MIKNIDKDKDKEFSNECNRLYKKESKEINKILTKKTKGISKLKLNHIGESMDKDKDETTISFKNEFSSNNQKSDIWTIFKIFFK